MKDFNQNMKRRVNVVYICILLMAFAIVFQIVKLMFVEGEIWRGRAENKTTRSVDVEAKRGNIYSSDSSILVMTMPIFTVRMDLYHAVIEQDTFNFYVSALADSLAKMFPQKSAKEHLKSLKNARNKNLGINPDTKKPRGFGARNFLIARNITYSEMKRLQTFPILEKGPFRGGLIVEEHDRRKPMHGLLAKRTIGYVRNNIFVGLEGAYDAVLRGVNGKRVERKIANGVWRPIFSDQQEPENGKDIVTTIDIRIQDVAENALMKCLRANHASHGCAILMEVSTGEIRAIANLTRGKDSLSYDELQNFAVGESAEPGSTLKLASLMAILETGKFDTNSIVPTGKRAFSKENIMMYDSHEDGYGEISLKRAFELSSNVGIAYAATESFLKNEKKFTDYLYKMRLNQKLGIEIKGEGDPIVRNPIVHKKEWSGISIPWMSTGYEMKMTPLQQLTFYNAVANNGTMVKPMFVKEIRSGRQVIQRFVPIVLEEQICSGKTIHKVKNCLEGVVQRGTAKLLSKSPYKIAGKTGTAVMNYRNKGVEKKRYRASFIGYFPADNPKYTCLVIITDPSKLEKYGGTVAAPVFKEIADKVYATHLNLDLELPDAEGFQPLVHHSREEKIEKLILSTKTVPDVKGWNVRDAVYLLENLGYKVKLNGRGMVREQSIAAGTPIAAGQQIWLRLS